MRGRARRGRRSGHPGILSGIVLTVAGAVLVDGCASVPETGRDDARPPVASVSRPIDRATTKPWSGRLPAGIQPRAGEAFFEMETILGDRFVFKLIDPNRIRQAREILDKKLPKRVVGQIVTTPEPYNKPWRFHLDPATVQFSYLTDDDCDGAIHYIEDHLEDVGQRILPRGRWCPLSSRLVQELLPASPAN